ncbi:MAG TPA: hypothetical protein VI112_15090 [Bacteroidia bacterium]
MKPMKRYWSASLLLLVTTCALAQTSKSDLCRDWKIKKGWFGDDNIVLEQLDTARQRSAAQVLAFKQEGALTTTYYNPQKVGVCGNGMLYFDAAAWSLNFNDITFDVAGGHFASDKFHYKMTYSVMLLSKGMLVLKKEKVDMVEEKKIGQ